MSDTRPILNEITDKEKEDGKLMAVLAYISILFVIPLFTSRDNKFVMFHVEQGITLFITSLVLRYLFIFIDGFLYRMINFSSPCGGGILSLAITVIIIVLWIMGILNAFGGKVAPLPIIGQYGEKFNLVK